MLKKYNQHKYGGPEYEGPYAITTVNDNGTVRIQRRKFYDIVNIRNIKPYYQRIVDTTYPDHGGECNVRSDDRVSTRRLSQSYVSNNNLVKVLLRFSPRSNGDKGFLNTQVMS